MMKWWLRIKDLRQNRWLPFYLPIIGTILYIALALIAVPSQFGDKTDAEGDDANKAAAVSSTSTVDLAKRSRRPGPKPPAAVSAAPPSP